MLELGGRGREVLSLKEAEAAGGGELAAFEECINVDARLPTFVSVDWAAERRAAAVI